MLLSDVLIANDHRCWNPPVQQATLCTLQMLSCLGRVDRVQGTIEYTNSTVKIIKLHLHSVCG